MGEPCGYYPGVGGNESVGDSAHAGAVKTRV